MVQSTIITEISYMLNMMNNDLFKQFNDFGKESFQPWLRLNGIANKSIERFTRQNIGTTSDIIALQMRQLQDLSNAKKIDEMFNVWNQGSKEATTRATEFSLQAMENFQNLAAEIGKWYEESFAAFAKQQQHAASAAGKAVNKTKSGTVIEKD